MNPSPIVGDLLPPASVERQHKDHQAQDRNAPGQELLQDDIHQQASVGKGTQTSRRPRRLFPLRLLAIGGSFGPSLLRCFNPRKRYRLNEGVKVIPELVRRSPQTRPKVAERLSGPRHVHCGNCVVPPTWWKRPYREDPCPYEEISISRIDGVVRKNPARSPVVRLRPAILYRRKKISSIYISI